MNWADFKIAIAKGLVASAESVANIVSGATKVGNADKLDGNDSSYFATKASVTNITNGTTTVPNADKLDGYHASDFIQTNGGIISNSTFATFAVNRTTSDAAAFSGMAFKKQGEVLGYIGVKLAGEGLCYLPPSLGGAYYPLLHTGNSTKVIVSTTAPTDTSAVWIVP